MMNMFEKCNSLKRCDSTLSTIPWSIFRGSLNGQIFTLQASTYLSKKANHLRILIPPVLLQKQEMLFMEKVYSVKFAK